MKLFGIEITLDFSQPPDDDEAWNACAWDRVEQSGLMEEVLLDAIQEYPDDPDYPQMLAEYQERQESKSGGLFGWLLG